MASYMGKTKHNDNVEICDGSKQSSFKNKRRNFTRKIRKKQQRFTNDSMFVLFKSKKDDELYSKDIGSDKELYDFDNSELFDEWKDSI